MTALAIAKVLTLQKTRGHLRQCQDLVLAVPQGVKGAGNRELFHLNDAQLSALMASMS